LLGLGEVEEEGLARARAAPVDGGGESGRGAGLEVASLGEDHGGLLGEAEAKAGEGDVEGARARRYAGDGGAQGGAEGRRESLEALGGEGALPPRGREAGD